MSSSHAFKFRSAPRWTQREEQPWCWASFSRRREDAAASFPASFSALGKQVEDLSVAFDRVKDHGNACRRMCVRPVCVCVCTETAYTSVSPWTSIAVGLLRQLYLNHFSNLSTDPGNNWWMGRYACNQVCKHCTRLSVFLQSVRLCWVKQSPIALNIKSAFSRGNSESLFPQNRFSLCNKSTTSVYFSATLSVDEVMGWAQSWLLNLIFNYLKFEWTGRLDGDEILLSDTNLQIHGVY